MSKPAMPTVAQNAAMNTTATSAAPISEPCATDAPATAGSRATVRANT